MRKFIFAGLLAFVAVIAAAQNPQTSTAPLYAVNSKYTNGGAPGYMPCGNAALNCPSTSALNLLIGPGTANCSGTIETYAGGTLTLTASTTNYIYLNTSASCIPAVKTTSFTTSDIPIATVVTGVSSISSIVDDRTIFFVPGGASGVTSLNTLLNAIVLVCDSTCSITTSGQDLDFHVIGNSHIAYNVNTGAVANPAAVLLNATVTGTIHGCTFVTTTSDNSTNLTFNLKLAGTSIFSGGAQTITAGTSSGTTSTLTLATSTISVTAGQQWALSISSGTSNWTGALSCN
jgi:hypothetical protein